MQTENLSTADVTTFATSSELTARQRAAGMGVRGLVVSASTKVLQEAAWLFVAAAFFALEAVLFIESLKVFRVLRRSAPSRSSVTLAR